MPLEVATCPYCKSPVSGVKCDDCKRKPSNADEVRCEECGDMVAEEYCTIHRYQKPVSAKWVTEYICWECQ